MVKCQPSDRIIDKGRSPRRSNKANKKENMNKNNNDNKYRAFILNLLGSAT